MLTCILRRLLLMIPTLLGVLIISYGLNRWNIGTLSDELAESSQGDAGSHASG